MFRSPHLPLVVLLLVSAPVLARGQSPPANPKLQAAMARADSLSAHGDWDGAARGYREAARIAPGDPRPWNRLGTSEYTLHHYKEAAAAYEKADAIRPNGATRYNLACCHALAADAPQAVRALRGAVALGFIQFNLVATDTDLDPIRGDPEFQKFAAEAAALAHPCASTPEIHQFDFWVGTWDVYNTAGQRAATSRITHAADDCAVMEHWMSVVGDSGISLNVYNGVEKKWQQTWINYQGRVSLYAGEFRDGAMHLEGYGESPGGQRLTLRMTFTPLPNGDVRQLGEQFTEGSGWAVSFDLLYRKKA